MSLESMTIAETWGSLPEERKAHFPCDDYAQGSAFFRAVDVAATVSTTFRWLCQLKVAPYSYDWLDNYGKQSPRMLTPGVEELAAGQRIMTIFTLVDFNANDHLTLQMTYPRALKIFGQVTVTYRVVPSNNGSRIIVKLIVQERGPLWHHFFAFGDLVMMRKQLLTLKQLAEKTPQS
jgi:hypothetical protein